MNKKVYQVECPKCHSANSLLTQQDCEEFRVCYNCGHVEANTKFDAMEFLVETVHNGITEDERMTENLIEELSDRFEWLTFKDAELLAGIMVNNYADNARFQAEAEDQEATEFYLEREEAAMGMY